LLDKQQAPEGIFCCHPEEKKKKIIIEKEQTTEIEKEEDDGVREGKPSQYLPVFSSEKQYP